MPRVTMFKPAGVSARDLEQLPLAVDELETIRLVDLEGLSHEQAASIMGVSRQTVGRVLERGHAKVAEALVAGKAILIGGGQYRVGAPPSALLLVPYDVGGRGRGRSRASVPVVRVARRGRLLERRRPLRSSARRSRPRSRSRWRPRTLDDDRRNRSLSGERSTESAMNRR